MSNTVYIPLSSDVVVTLVNRYKGRYTQAAQYIIEDFLDKTADQYCSEPRETEKRAVCVSRRGKA